MQRRAFIGALGAGIAAGPLVLPARARGANDRIGLAFVGVGKMGMAHLRWFVNQPDVEVRGIAEVETFRREMARQLVVEKNAELKRASRGVVATVDYRTLLGRKDIDAVVISTPDHWHTAQLVDAARARKDVYCEKPLTLTLEESELCVKAVRKHKIVMQTGSQQRSENDGRFRTAAEYVRSGRLGKVRSVSVHFGPTAKSCDLPEEKMDPGLDWDRWLGQAPRRPYHHLLCQRGTPDKYPFLPGWRDYREYSGGQVTDWGCHHLDIVQWALGMDGAGPSEALPGKGDPARGGGQLVYPKTPVGDDIVVTHRTYGNGIRIVGELGELWVNRGELVSLPDRIVKEPLGDRDVRLENPGTNHRRNWLDCIRSRKDPICNVEVGAGTAAVCHLLNLAYWNERPVRWDPKTWALASGAPPDWRSRPQRKGYELPRV